jgi:hypothetical protein
VVVLGPGRDRRLARVRQHSLPRPRQTSNTHPSKK